MAKTDILQVQEQIQKFWSPMSAKELRQQLLLGGLVSKEFSGSLQRKGDTVYVSQVTAPAGQLRSIGVDADSFDTDLLTTNRIAIVADKRAVAAYEIEDIVDLQSQLDKENSDVRDALMYSVSKQINDYLYSLVAPSNAAPDHTITGIGTFAASNLAEVRKLLSEAKVPMDGNLWALLSPAYYADMLNAQTLTSSDYIGSETPVVGGQIVSKRFGFNIVEDNSRTGDYGLFFHPSWMNLVMQTEPVFKLSDLHSNKQFGYVLSVDLIFGAKMAYDGAVRHVTVTS